MLKLGLGYCLQGISYHNCKPQPLGLLSVEIHSPLKKNYKEAGLAMMPQFITMSVSRHSIARSFSVFIPSQLKR